LGPALGALPLVGARSRGRRYSGWRARSEASSDAATGDSEAHKREAGNGANPVRGKLKNLNKYTARHPRGDPAA